MTTMERFEELQRLVRGAGGPERLPAADREYWLEESLRLLKLNAKETAQ